MSSPRHRCGSGRPRTPPERPQPERPVGAQPARPAEGAGLGRKGGRRALPERPMPPRDRRAVSPSIADPRKRCKELSARSNGSAWRCLPAAWPRSLPRYRPAGSCSSHLVRVLSNPSPRLAPGRWSRNRTGSGRGGLPGPAPQVGAESRSSPNSPQRLSEGDSLRPDTGQASYPPGRVGSPRRAGPHQETPPSRGTKLAGSSTSCSNPSPIRVTRTRICRSPSPIGRTKQP